MPTGIEVFNAAGESIGFVSGKEDGSGRKLLEVEATAFPRILSYLGDHQVGVAPGLTFTFPTGARGVLIKVEHATQTIRVGMGPDQATSEAVAAVAGQIKIVDGFVPFGRANKDIKYFTLIGSGALTDCNVMVL